MRKITKKIPARIVVRYECKFCKNKYLTANQARECEKRVTEKKQFKIGQKVKRALRVCYGSGPMPHTMRTMQGKVVKILGPVVMDCDYEARNLGGKRIDWHVYLYNVDCICPLCKKIQRLQLYAPELKNGVVPKPQTQGEKDDAKK